MNSLGHNLNYSNESYLDQRSKIGTGAGSNDIVQNLLSASRGYKFHEVIIADLNKTSAPNPMNQIAATSLDNNFFYQFYETFRADQCPILNRARYAVSPFGWGVSDIVDLIEPALGRTEHDSRDAITSLFEDYGFGGGYAVPVRGVHGQMFVVVFGSPYDCTGISLPELLQSTLELMEKFLSQLHYAELAAYRLTRREVECLAWVSEGKTSNEIAKIVNLSEHTVNHYLLSATRKLNTFNRTEAVVKALRAGLI